MCKNSLNLHHLNIQTHGVAVTLLILVQSSGVRIPVGLQYHLIISDLINLQPILHP